MKVLWALILLGLVLASAAGATVGGPVLARALGWDPVGKKVFFVVEPMDESNLGPQIYYFALSSKDPTTPHWIHRTSSEQVPTTPLEQVKRLESRLQPLRERMRVSELPTIGVSADTVLKYGDRRPHALVELLTEDIPAGRSDTLRVDIYDRVSSGHGLWGRSPFVRLLREYAIPGRTEHCGILSFIGIPFEDGYEFQAPIVWDNTGRTIHLSEDSFEHIR